MILGSHLSISGGLHEALKRADALGFNALAMFLRNQVQWHASRLAEKAVEQFRATRAETGVVRVVAHASYLINLSGSQEVRDKSIAAMIEDFSRCQRLGVEYLVVHPGSHPDVRDGVRLIVEALRQILEACPEAAGSGGDAKLLLETTAGQGDSLGRDFEQIAAMLDGVGSGRCGVCLDTAHIFAAGYDIRTPKTYAETMKKFDKTVGLARLCAVHLNDSKKALGSRVDRHEHIGLGLIALAGLGQVVRDKRLADVPMILETPKGAAPDGRDWDVVNAETVRGLLSGGNKPG